MVVKIIHRNILLRTILTDTNIYTRSFLLQRWLSSSSSISKRSIFKRIRAGVLQHLSIFLFPNLCFLHIYHSFHN